MFFNVTYDFVFQMAFWNALPRVDNLWFVFFSVSPSALLTKIFGIATQINWVVSGYFEHFFWDFWV